MAIKLPGDSKFRNQKPDLKYPGKTTKSNNASSKVEVNNLKPYWEIDGFPLIDPAHLKKSLDEQNPPIPTNVFWGKANSFVEVRGRNPSKGWVLVTGETLAKLKKLQDVKHQLKIWDGQRWFRREGLVITKATCVSPTHKDGTQAVRGKGSPNITSVYLLELADARYYGSWGSLYWAYNIRGPEGNFPYGLNYKTWPDVLEDMWKRGMPRALGKLHIDDTGGKESWPPFAPENLRYMGVNTWDAFNELLDQIGRTIAPAFNNPEGGYVVYGLEKNTWLSNNEQEALKAATDSAMIQAEGAPIQAHVPQWIRVYFRSRDNQWWKNRGSGSPRTLTAQDFVNDFPGRYIDYKSESLVPSLSSNATIIEGTMKHVWGTLPIIVGDDNEIFSRREIYQQGKKLATETVESLTLFQRFRGWTFSGIWPFFRTGPVFSGIAYYDLGDGLKTRLFTRPLHFDSDIDLEHYNESSHKGKHPDEDWVGPPDVQRHRQPHYREGYGIIVPHPSLTRTCYLPPVTKKDIEKPFKGKSTFRGVGPGCSAEVILLAGKIGNYENQHCGIEGSSDPPYIQSVKGQMWYGVARVTAFNVTDEWLDFGKRVMLRWNPQPGPCGVWQMISTERKSFDVQAECVRYAYEPPAAYWRRRRPDLITVRRDSSLRLVSRVNPHKNICEAIIDIAPGPSKTIYQSRSPSEVPRWVHEPEVSGSMKVGRWLKFNPGGYGAESWIGPPTNGSTKFRLPHPTNLNSGAYLIAGGVSGNCVQTEWFGGGIDATISFNYAIEGSSCVTEFNCIGLNFENGLLVSISGDHSGGGSMWPSQGGAYCGDYKEPDYNPCQYQQVPGYPSPPTTPGRPRLPDPPVTPGDEKPTDPPITIPRGRGPVAVDRTTSTDSSSSSSTDVPDAPTTPPDGE